MMESINPLYYLSLWNSFEPSPRLDICTTLGQYYEMGIRLIGLFFDEMQTPRSEPAPLLKTDDVHLYTRLKWDAPGLWKMIQTHDRILKEIADFGGQISSLLEPAVKRYFEDNGLLSEFDEGGIRTLNDTILKQIDEYGDQHEHAEIWSEHRDELCSIIGEVVADEYDELQNGDKPVSNAL